MRRRGVGHTPVKNENMSHPTPSPPRGRPDPKFTPDEAFSSGSPGSPGRRTMDHTPSSRQFSSSEFLSTRKNLDSLFGDNKDSTTTSSPLNDIASQLQSDFDETIDSAAERLQTLAVEVDESEVGDIITSGVVPPLIRALERHPNPEEELAALQNLGAATDTEGLVKGHMIECGVVEAVLPFLSSPQTTVARLAVAVMLNLAIDSEERKSLLVESGITEKIALLLQSPDMGLVSTTVNALTSLSIGSEHRKRLIEHHGCLARAVELLQDPDHDLKLELLGFIQSLVYCNDERKRRLLNLDFIPIISLLLANDESSPMLKETAARLLKGLAGFSAHEARKSPSKASPTRVNGDAPAASMYAAASMFGTTFTAISDVTTWAATMALGK